MELLKTSAVPSQEFECVLDNQNCTIRLLTRGVGGALFCDLEVDDNVIWQGQLCVNKMGIKPAEIYGFKGNLYFFDTKGDEDPYWEGLGDRYCLLYVSESETRDSELSDQFDPVEWMGTYYGE